MKGLGIKGRASAFPAFLEDFPQIRERIVADLSPGSCG